MSSWQVGIAVMVTRPVNCRDKRVEQLKNATLFKQWIPQL
jgi:hypothetical protein